MKKAKRIHQEKPEIILNAWRTYCMESRIFRILVKLGLRH